MKKVFALFKSAKSYVSKYEQDNPSQSGVAQKVVGGLLIADGLVGLENPLDGRKTRAGMLSSLYSLVVIIIFFFVAQFFTNAVFIKADASTTGTVTSIGAPVSHTTRHKSSSTGRYTTSTSTTCSITVEYVVKGKTYTGSPGDTSSSYCHNSVGNNVDVKYESITPERFTIGNTEAIIGKALFFVPIIMGISVFCTFLVRLFTFIFGIVLYRRGGRILKANPIADGISFADHAEVVKNDFLEKFYSDRSPARALASRFGFSRGSNSNNGNNYGNNNNFGNSSGTLQGLGQLLGAAGNALNNQNNNGNNEQLPYQNQPQQSAYQGQQPYQQPSPQPQHQQQPYQNLNPYQNSQEEEQVQPEEHNQQVYPPQNPQQYPPQNPSTPRARKPLPPRPQAPQAPQNQYKDNFWDE